MRLCQSPRLVEDETSLHRDSRTPYGTVWAFSRYLFAGRTPPPPLSAGATFRRHRGEQVRRRNSWLPPCLQCSIVTAATLARTRGASSPQDK